MPPQLARKNEEDNFQYEDISSGFRSLFGPNLCQHFCVCSLMLHAKSGRFLELTDQLIVSRSGSCDFPGGQCPMILGSINDRISRQFAPFFEFPKLMGPSPTF